MWNCSAFQTATRLLLLERGAWVLKWCGGTIDNFLKCLARGRRALIVSGCFMYFCSYWLGRWSTARPVFATSPCAAKEEHTASCARHDRLNDSHLCRCNPSVAWPAYSTCDHNMSYMWSPRNPLWDESIIWCVPLIVDQTAKLQAERIPKSCHAHR